MNSNIYKLINKDGLARRGEITTVHGKFQTPAFTRKMSSNLAKTGALVSIKLFLYEKECNKQ